MWNSILAGVIFQHPTNASLIRELKRNGQLRAVCGFNGKTPDKHNYGRFLKSLVLHQHEIDAMFNLMVERLKGVLPDFGEIPAGDGKPIESFSKRAEKINKENRSGRTKRKRCKHRCKTKPEQG
jgi:hypothetical protein